MIRDIQLLRGIAVLFVVFAHLPAIYPAVTELGLNWLGWWTGVDIFLAVSGFVIAKSFFPTIESSENKIRVSLAFWIRRAYRLLPAALFWATFLVLMVYTFNSTNIFGLPSGVLDEYISVLLQAKNIAAIFQPSFSMGPYWSLSLEQQFYFLLPFAVVLTPAIFRPLGGLSLMIVLLVLSWKYEAVMKYFRVAPILAGILIYQLSLSDWHRRLEPKFMSLFVIRLAILVCLVVLILVSGASAGIQRWFVITGVSAIFVFLASYDKDYLSFPLLSFFIEWVGYRSYSVYVAHMPILLLSYEVGHRIGVIRTSVLLPAALLVLCVCSALSYAILERPMQRKGREKAEEYLKRSQKMTITN